MSFSESLEGLCFCFIIDVLPRKDNSLLQLSGPAVLACGLVSRLSVQKEGVLRVLLPLWPRSSHLFI